VSRWSSLPPTGVSFLLCAPGVISILRRHTNNAESFFSRMRRAEIGHHHHLAGPYLARFAQESAWREDHRRDPNGCQVDRVALLAMRNKPSVDFCGYWQRSWAA
jgi:hypothetical protein